MHDEIERCPVCYEPTDYCQGHGEIGDPAGAEALAMHDTGDHSRCIYGGTLCEHDD